MSMYDLGPSFIDGPEGPDRSLLAHCLTDTWKPSTGVVPHAVEFGTGTGETAEMIAAYLPLITFDSFMGLPEDWRPEYLKGHFDHLPVRDIFGALVVAGWFKDTVVGFPWPKDIALVHFDADLYSSTITALASIGPHLRPGAILVFDEFHGYDDDFMGTLPGEQQAFREYATAYRWEWDVIGHGREQWAIRLTKTGASK